MIIKKLFILTNICLILYQIGYCIAPMTSTNDINEETAKKTEEIFKCFNNEHLEKIFKILDENQKKPEKYDDPYYDEFGYEDDKETVITLGTLKISPKDVLDEGIKTLINVTDYNDENDNYKILKYLLCDKLTVYYEDFKIILEIYQSYPELLGEGVVDQIKSQEDEDPTMENLSSDYSAQYYDELYQNYHILLELLKNQNVRQSFTSIIESSNNEMHKYFTQNEEVINTLFSNIKVELLQDALKKTENLKHLFNFKNNLLGLLSGNQDEADIIQQILKIQNNKLLEEMIKNQKFFESLFKQNSISNIPTIKDILNGIVNFSA